MKYLIILLTVLLASTSVSLLIKDDPGYVVLSYGQWTAETSLAFLIGSVLVGYCIAYACLRLFLFIWRLPRFIRKQNTLRKANRARLGLNKGLIELAEGRWQAAEKLLAKHAPHSENPLINYLSAARAAQHLDAHERRDEYLRLAHKNTPAADIAIGLTQAELQLAHNQTEQALATLTHLRGLAPKHNYVIRLLAKLYQELGDWQQLCELLPSMRKRHILSEKKLTALENTAFKGYLLEASKHTQHQPLVDAWQTLPKKLKEEEDLFCLYIKNLSHFKLAQDEAEQLLRTRLNKHWSESSAELYGKIQATDHVAQLEYAESCLKKHENSAALLLALGRLSTHSQLWGKARHYLETSISIQPSPDAHMKLGELLEHQMNDKESAQEHFKKGLKLSVVDDPSGFLPVLQNPKAKYSVPDHQITQIDTLIKNQTSS